MKPLTVTSNGSKKNGKKQHSNHHGGPHITEQFKLVTNAQESKIFKSNVTTIKIKCSNNFPRRYTFKITYTSLGIKRKFHYIFP